VLAGLCLLLIHAVVPAGPPPPAPRNMPGEVKGELKTRWLAPFVSAGTRRVGPARATEVRWYTDEGKVGRELAGPHVEAQPGFVYEYEGGRTTVHAINGDWKVALPKKDGPAGYLTATPDSRTFVHEFHPREGEIAADVYVEGKLADTVGPYPQYQGQDVHLGDDGSLALLIFKNGDSKVPVVVVAGPGGKVRFEAACDGPVLFPAPAPGGEGVLVQSNGGGDAPNTFTLYTRQGKGAKRTVGPNAHFVLWLPGTRTALFLTSIGHDYRFHLIDWDSGKRLWEIADPNPARVPGAFPATAAAGDYLLFGGLEDVTWGERKEAVRSIHAVDAKTGRVAARWLPSPLYQASADGGHFLRLEKKLFLVTDEEFAEVRLADVAARRNGWR
jgi:hypothetical protein